MKACVSEPSPTPALFLAKTRNLYSLFSSKFGTRTDVSSDDTSTCFLHLVLYLSLTSTTYPVMVSPPSELGGAHSTSADVAVMLEVLGALGALGASRDKCKNGIKKLKTIHQQLVNNLSTIFYLMFLVSHRHMKDRALNILKFQQNTLFGLGSKLLDLL